MCCVIWKNHNDEMLGGRVEKSICVSVSVSRGKCVSMNVSV